MPQFDPANFPHQLFWLALVFAILYFGIIKLSLPKISGMIDERQSRVDTDIKAAEVANAKATAAEHAYLDNLAKSRAAAQKHLGGAKAESDAKIAADIKATEVEMTAKLNAADVRINAAKQQALTSVESVASDVAVNIVERLTGVRFAA